VSYSNNQTGPGRSAPRPTVAAGTRWAGGFATVVVAAMAYAVGIVVVRVVFDIPVLAPEKNGAPGDSTTWQLAMTAFAVALLATALMHMLLLVMPRALHRAVRSGPMPRPVRPSTGDRTQDARLADSAGPIPRRYDPYSGEH
jgi:hypothetical protein